MGPPERTEISHAIDYADAVAEEIQMLRRLYRAHLVRAYDNVSTDMVHLGGRVLAYVADHADCTQSDLVEHLKRDKSQIAKIVAGLRGKGMLAVEPVETDRRRQRLILTEKGVLAVAESQGNRDRVARAALRGLTSHEREQMLALMRRVRSNLEG